MLCPPAEIHRSLEPMSNISNPLPVFRRAHSPLRQLQVPDNDLCTPLHSHHPTYTKQQSAASPGSAASLRQPQELSRIETNRFLAGVLAPQTEMGQEIRNYLMEQARGPAHHRFQAQETVLEARSALIRRMDRDLSPRPPVKRSLNHMFFRIPPECTHPVLCTPSHQNKSSVDQRHNTHTDTPSPRIPLAKPQRTPLQAQTRSTMKDRLVEKEP